MRLIRLVVPATLAVLIGSVSGFAQETHPHKHELSEKLGRVNFATSCTKPAQQKFNRAVALLHSFWYDEAEKAFNDVAQTDPKCTMGYWGVAMSLYHPLWAPPLSVELQTGRRRDGKGKRHRGADATRAGLRRRDRVVLSRRGQGRSPHAGPRLRESDGATQRSLSTGSRSWNLLCACATGNGAADRQDLRESEESRRDSE